MKKIYKLIIAIPILSTLVTTVVFIGLGVYGTGEGMYGLFTGQIHTDYRPGLQIIEALDLFLIGFLFFIFSVGFSQLFFPKDSRLAKTLDGITPDWLNVEEFMELKLILWDTIMTVLVVKFVGDIYRNEGDYSWQIMIIPLAVLIIALSRYLIKKSI